MPSVQQLLNTEIRRLARKEIKTALESLMEANRVLKGRIADLEKAVKSISQHAIVSEPASGSASDLSVAQISVRMQPIHPKTVKLLRKKLGLSQKQLAILLEVSPLSVCFWENGHVSPGPECRRKINELRAMPKAEIWKRISELGMKISRRKMRRQAKQDAIAVVTENVAPATTAVPEQQA